MRTFLLVLACLAIHIHALGSNRVEKEIEDQTRNHSNRRAIAQFLLASPQMSRRALRTTDLKMQYTGWRSGPISHQEQMAVSSRIDLEQRRGYGGRSPYGYTAEYWEDWEEPYYGEGYGPHREPYGYGLDEFSPYRGGYAMDEPWMQNRFHQEGPGYPMGEYYPYQWSGERYNIW